MLTPPEQRCLSAFRAARDGWPEAGRVDEPDAWIEFVLAATLHAGSLLRELTLQPSAAAFKRDGSPFVPQELEIELMIRDRLGRFSPGTTFLGEESGGELAASGVSVAVDPVDGTWALLNRTSTTAVVIAAFRDGRPFVGAVASPSTGEIAYACEGGAARCVQLGTGGDDDRGATLPLDRATADSILVNVHPARTARGCVDRLMGAWQRRDVHMVRMMGGSPSGALLEAAKGAFVYVNLWDRKAAAPFDLAAGCLLVRRAGGRVVDLDGREIDASSHAGAFVAGVDDRARGVVVELLATADREHDP